MIKIDCKKYADEILGKVADLPDKGELLIVTAGQDAASHSYIKGKLSDCAKCGIKANIIEVTDQESLAHALQHGNSSDRIAGILVEYPLPEGLNSDTLISLSKDVDGAEENSPFLPCTAEGILYVLKKELGDLTGKTALVVGRGKLVGKPVADLLLAANCTVTVAHSKTQNLERLIENFDIIVSGAGIPGLIDLSKCHAEMVVDAGTGIVDGKLHGDCIHLDPETEPDMKVITMPNGIGLLTRAVLMAHVAGMPLT